MCDYEYYNPKFYGIADFLCTDECFRTLEAFMAVFQSEACNHENADGILDEEMYQLGGYYQNLNNECDLNAEIDSIEHDTGIDRSKVTKFVNLHHKNAVLFYCKSMLGSVSK